MVVRIMGDITFEAFKEFCEQVDECLAEEIFVELASNGGDPAAGIAFATKMQSLSNKKFDITVYGAASSAASLILAAGDYRKMQKDAQVLLHEEALEFDGRITSFEKEARMARKSEDVWNNLLEQYTGTDAKTWEKIHRDEALLSAEECLALGLIDEVV